VTKPKCSVYIATSVDGFIARPDGDIEWLHNPAYITSEKLGLEYADFISTVDGLVMGRKSFEKVLTFGEWPYQSVEVIVLSSRELVIPAELADKVRTESGEPQEIVTRLAQAGKTHLYIDGGITVQQFLEAGLIDEITITQIPVILGDGIPLFGAMRSQFGLTHVETTALGNGFVQSRYLIQR